MPITYDSNRRCFQLDGGDVSCVLHVDDEGRLMNLYWGKRLPVGAIEPRPERYASWASFDLPVLHKPWELPGRGMGWFGAPAVDVVNAAGDDIVDLRYAGHAIIPGKRPLSGLPATYVEEADEAVSLEITLQDALTGLKVVASYTVFEAWGAIARHLEIENASPQTMRLKGAWSASVPLWGDGYDVVHLKGAWGRERRIMRTPLGQGEYRIESQRGASGHEENPFMALCAWDAGEYQGEVWAMSLVYSGSFLALASVDNRFNARMAIGLNPSVFEWRLEPQERFVTPEAVLVYSDRGLGGMSHIYHGLYRTRLVRGYWRDRERPMLVNNWEGTYFDFDEDRLLAIARRASEIGAELFVLDDGWFGRRDSDDSSLGDWMVYEKKLPHGLGWLAEQINGLGMKFGLWFEPEMVSPDSDLYRAHPDWCLHVEWRERTQARHQLVLDMARPEVQDYVAQAVTRVLESANIEYVKWDMNRNMTQGFSAALPPERRLESQHRYMLGLYRVLKQLTAAFPKVLFECCSGGGGRFDPGMLYYMPQTWTSDDTDAVERLAIQYGTSLVYPPSAMGAHVSAVPNHQTGRVTSLQFRGDVALGGCFGFEMDLDAMDKAELETAALLTRRAKALRGLTSKGIFTRLIDPAGGRLAAWQFVSSEKDRALLCVYRILATPNMPAIRVRMRDLDPRAAYRDEQGKLHSGAALMSFGLWLDAGRDFESDVILLERVEA